MIETILKNIRKTRKLTQEEMGKKLNLASNTISGYETGASRPDFETIKKFINVCDFDIQFVDRQSEKVYSIEELSKEMDF